MCATTPGTKGTGPMLAEFLTPTARLENAVVQDEQSIVTHSSGSCGSMVGDKAGRAWRLIWTHLAGR